MNGDGAIRRAHSHAPDAREAAREFHAQLGDPQTGLVVFFCSSRYDLEVLGGEMNRLFPDVTVVGCTTAGEIGPAGYCEHSLSGFALPAGDCPAAAGLLGSLQRFEVSQGQRLAHSLQQQLESRVAALDERNCFALLLIDGLSRREELVTHAVQSALGDIPLVGGSAGDDLRFERTWVFHGGAFHTDAAVLILVHCALPFRTFKTQHFVSQAERLVVTDADAPQRVVREINGLPAAQEYARLIGARVEDLTPQRFAASPVVVLIDGTDYVRSIQKANPDGSLTFYCAIEIGLVLRVASGINLLDHLRQTFSGLRDEIGPPQAVLTFDCVLRNLEITQKGLKEAVGDIFRHNRAVGFSTYGEQYRGVHVNQTLTGVAIAG